MTLPPITYHPERECDLCSNVGANRHGERYFCGECLEDMRNFDPKPEEDIELVEYAKSKTKEAGLKPDSAIDKFIMLLSLRRKPDDRPDSDAR